MATINKKLVVNKNSNVGKTSLIKTHTEGEFPSSIIGEVVERKHTNILIDGNNVELDIFDTNEDFGYDRIRPLSYPNTDVVMICFDLSNKGSFDRVFERWYPEIKHHLPNIPIVLCGTKSDITKRVVFQKDIDGALSSIPGSEYVETSSKGNDGMDEAFTVCASITDPVPEIKQSACIIL